jgi:nucleotide-binding universal stress UspA family protein
MAKRILAPVDGGEHGEDIAPIVAALARDAGSTVRLLRVFPVPERVVGPHGRTVAYVDQEMARLTAEGLADLRQVEAELGDVPVEAVVRFGEPAEEITLEAEAFDADLIALGGGRSGRLRSALAPDLAQRVERRAKIPTLVLRG